MKIQIASDLHLERPENYNCLIKDRQFKTIGEVLVLAGDIYNLCDTTPLDSFLELYGKQFSKILYVGGNHEWYNSSINTTKLPKKTDKFIPLFNDDYVYKGVRFIGSTFWSNATPEMADYINDYHLIKDFTTELENKIHTDSKRYMINKLDEKFDGKTVVITHHLPLFECVDPLYAGNALNECFVSDQSEIVEKYDIYAWIHGHSHMFQDFTYHGTKVVRNPFGYYPEWGDFKQGYTIEIP